MRLLESIHNVDVVTFSWCLRRKHRDLAVLISRCVSFTADGPLYVLVGLAFLAGEGGDLATLLAVGFVAERSCYFTFKKLFRRNRPPAAIPGFRSVIEPSDKFSFPSGHTSAAFLFAFALSSAYPMLAWILYPWATSVGIARVMLGVHFPTDVLAGALMGHTICYVMVGVLA